MQVLTIQQVAESLKTLRQLGIHRSAIIMYLSIKRSAAKQETRKNIKADFPEFVKRYFSISGAPKPYIIPFEKSNANLWLDTNIAGSYAPSSVKPGNPIHTAVETEGSRNNVTYSLKSDHSRQARLNICKGTKIPVLDLAIFLYRDYGFDSDEMDAMKLVHIFQDEFGYLKDENATSDFDELYSFNPESAPKELFASFSNA